MGIFLIREVVCFPGVRQAILIAKADVVASIDAYRKEKRQLSIDELDKAEQFSMRTHTAGENASALIYACGVTWLSQLIGFEKAISFGMLPFLYGDALKLVIASLGMPFAWSFVNKMMK